jgi:hypothetical protein
MVVSTKMSRQRRWVNGDLIFLKQDSWRDKDKLDVLAMQEILARESKK